jgi:phosphonate transport system permease protein
VILGAKDVSPDAIAFARKACPAAFAGGPAWRSWVAWGALAGLTAYCLWLFDFTPARLWSGLGNLAGVLAHMFPPTPKDALSEYLYAMGQTVAMAFLGTAIAAVLSVPLGMLCARNVLANRFGRFFFRRGNDVLRGVDQLIWALIFVRAVGLGPLAGILAIIISDTGTLAKLYSEAIENVEKRPLDGVRACGGDAAQTARFGILPQVLPVMLSNALYIFESNVRSATILGIVGAGGIGFYLADRIRTLMWEEACFIMLLILATVYLIDAASKLIRQRLIRGREAPAAVLH